MICWLIHQFYRFNILISVASVVELQVHRVAFVHDLSILGGCS